MQILIEYSVLCTYIPRLYIKKAKGVRLEYVQINLEYYNIFISAKKAI